MLTFAELCGCSLYLFVITPTSQQEVECKAQLEGKGQHRYGDDGAVNCLG